VDVDRLADRGRVDWATDVPAPAQACLRSGEAFLGPGAGPWLIEAEAEAVAGTSGIRVPTAGAVEPAVPAGVGLALGLAATAGRFAGDDLMSIGRHRRHGSRLRRPGRRRRNSLRPARHLGLGRRRPQACLIQRSRTPPTPRTSFPDPLRARPANVGP